MRQPGATLLVLLLSGAAGAAPAVLSVAAGLDNQTVGTRGVPVRVQVTALDTPFRGRIEIPAESVSGLSEVLYSAAVEVPASGSRTYWLIIWPPGPLADVAVRLVDSSGHRQEVTAALDIADDMDHLVGLVHPSGSGLRFLRREAGGTPHQPWVRSSDYVPARLVANLSVDELPPQPAGYQALQALILADATITTARPAVKAMEAWVHQGGHLIIVGGAASAGLLQDPTLAGLAPVQVDGLRLASARELIGRRGGERYAVSNAIVRPGASRLPVPGQPFVATWRRGAGRVTFMPAAYDQPPLDAWDGQPRMWQTVLAYPTSPPFLGAPAHRALRVLRSLASAIPGVQTPALATLGGFLMLYLVVLIPVQFAVLRRLDRRELAWLVTPLIAALFTFGAYLLGLHLKGGKVVLHSASLVEAGSGEASGEADSVTALFSPARRAYDLVLPRGTTRVALLRERGYDFEPQTPVVVETTSTGLRLPSIEVGMWALRLARIRHPIVLGGQVKVSVSGTPPGLGASVWNGLGRTLHAPTLVLRNAKSAGARYVPLGTELKPGQSRTIAPRHWRTSGEYWPESFSSYRPKHFSLPQGYLRHTYPEIEEVAESSRTEVVLWSWVEQAGGPVKLEGGEARSHQLWLLGIHAAPALGEGRASADGNGRQ